MKPTATGGVTRERRDDASSITIREGVPQAVILLRISWNVLSKIEDGEGGEGERRDSESFAITSIYTEDLGTGGGGGGGGGNAVSEAVSEANR